MKSARLLVPTVIASLAVACAPAFAAPTSVDLEFGSTGGTVLDKDGEATGFTGVIAAQGGGEHDPTRIDLQPAQNQLKLTATQGTNARQTLNDGTVVNPNSAKNLLSVDFDATGASSTTRTIGARLEAPFDIRRASTQAGIFFGPSQDDYIKLVLNWRNGDPAIQLGREISSSASNPNFVGVGLVEFDQDLNLDIDDVDTIDLFLHVDAATGVVSADFSINGGIKQIVTTNNENLPASYTINSTARGSFFNATSKAGLLAFTGTAGDGVVTYDWFRVAECVATGGEPTVTQVNPSPGETGVPRDAAVTAEVNLPNCGGIETDTITPETVRIVDVATGQPVESKVNTSGGGDVLVVQPVAALNPNEQYRFEVSSGLEDLSGAAFKSYQSTFRTGTSAGSTGNGTFTGTFTKQPTSAPLLVGGEGYTSVQKGPDGKLYAATNTGDVYRFPINADGSLGTSEKISSLTAAEGGPRIIIGLAFDPTSTPENPILWISHNQFTFSTADDWTGKVSRLSGPGLTNVEDVLVNLPRSQRDHMTNSIVFRDGKLYLAQGANTAMGAPDNAWGQRPERELTAAILELDPAKLGALPLDVKTKDGGGTYDPRAAGAPLTIFGTGVRNAYDLIAHSNGQLYAPTNGSASGGTTPTTPATLPAYCDNRIDFAQFGDYNGPNVIGAVGVASQDDFLYRIEKGGYYGAPNPTRCEWVQNGGNPTSGKDGPVAGASTSGQTIYSEVLKYPVGTQPDRNYRSANVWSFGQHFSPNGATEYRSNAFNGALAGTMIVTRYSAGDDLILLTPNGTNGNIATWQTGVKGLSGFNNPLDVTEDPSTGNLYVIEYPDPSNSGDPSRILLVKPAVPATGGGNGGGGNGGGGNGGGGNGGGTPTGGTTGGTTNPTPGPTTNTPVTNPAAKPRYCSRFPGLYKTTKRQLAVAKRVRAKADTRREIIRANKRLKIVKKTQRAQTLKFKKLCR